MDESYTICMYDRSPCFVSSRVGSCHGNKTYLLDAIIIFVKCKEKCRNSRYPTYFVFCYFNALRSVS